MLLAKKNSLQKTKCKNVAKLQNYATIVTIGRHLEHQTPSGIGQKAFLLWICLIKMEAQNKNQHKNVQKSLSYGKKSSYSAILKKAAILKTCEQNFLIVSNLESS
jgi:hypothetical protein